MLLHYTCYSSGVIRKVPAHLEVAGHPVSELLGILGVLVIEVDGRDVLQQLTLLIHRCDHLRVAMPHAHGYNAGKGLKGTG